MTEQNMKQELVEQLSKLPNEKVEAIKNYLWELQENEANQAGILEQYLTFWCDGQLFAIGIEQVIQIIQITDITPLPDFPDYVKGVLSVRGEMVPVMDLRLRLKKPEAAYDDRTCIIIVKVQNRSFGLIVDGMNDVQTIPEAEICAPPEQANHKASYLIGIARKENVVLLLDVEYILSDTEISTIFSSSDDIFDNSHA